MKRVALPLVLGFCVVSAAGFAVGRWSAPEAESRSARTEPGVGEVSSGEGTDARAALPRNVEGTDREPLADPEEIIETLQRQLDERTAALTETERALRERERDLVLLQGFVDPEGTEEFGLSPEEAAARVGAARGEFERALADADGRKLLDLLKEMQSLGEAGYPFAMEIAVALGEDMRGEERLNLRFPDLIAAVTPELQTYALEHPDANPEFRRGAVFGYRWQHGTDAMVEAFARLLPAEPDSEVARRMMRQLERTDAPGSVGAILAYGTRSDIDSGARAESVIALSGVGGSEADEAARRIANRDASPEVRDALKAYETIRNPPARGVVVTGLRDDGGASGSGIRPGDLIVGYDGEPVRGYRDLARRTRRNGDGGDDGFVTVDVMRDGRVESVQVPRGRLGVDGRSVNPEE